MQLIGNTSLLEQKACGFLCSRTAKSSIIFPCLDWAVEQSKGDVPVMSTFHSKMEQAVLKTLLRGTCPVIMVLGRKPYSKYPEDIQAALDSNRLLIVSLTDQPRNSKPSSLQANQYICQHATHLIFGFLHQESSLYPLYQQALDDRKSVKLIDSVL